MQQLENIRIVLVEPQHPGNIGAAARAMKAMGLSDLALVMPHAFPHAVATARAAGADELLEAAGCFDSLAAAIADCRLVIGASARRRHLDLPALDPRESAQQACGVEGQVALVFGRERSGLSNDELDLCHRHLMIPANPGYASLNLAAAVQVVCYEVRMAALAGEQVEQTGELAPTQDLERFFQHLQDVLVAGDFLDPEKPKLLLRRLRRLFHRAQLEAVEVQLLRGVLTALDPRKRRP